ncbi:uncharacterized protein LOC116348645 [Contarinia nasturtii]|uniref:uncharacterized protein LOC116348645 n=1 Tax=Contarinia nasturtii TaxID=265458 RepID=UPI0012D49125|nr:uncharacterized protein LOC116348645 [Contarinia nasturtii]
MPYYRVFCTFCSVRLGAIIVGIISFIEIAIYTIIISTKGSDFFITIAKCAEDYIRDNGLDAGYLSYPRYLETNKDTLFTVFISFHGVHLVTCVVDIIGAFLLNQWLLLPYILLEMTRLFVASATFCIFMIVIKKAINLGYLITYWVSGTFVILLLGYLWACVLSLFQVIFIVKSEKYRSVYGDDPLHPLQAANAIKSMKNTKVERVKIFPSPNFKDTEKLKSLTKSNNCDHPFAISRSQRIRNEYMEMRRNYLNETSLGHG